MLNFSHVKTNKLSKVLLSTINVLNYIVPVCNNENKMKVIVKDATKKLQEQPPDFVEWCILVLYRVSGSDSMSVLHDGECFTAADV